MQNLVYFIFSFYIIFISHLDYISRYDEAMSIIKDFLDN